MCRQVEQAGHTGVCLGRGITVNISITRSVGYAASCFLFPSAALWSWHGCGKMLFSSSAHTPHYLAVVKQVQPMLSEEFLWIYKYFDQRWLTAACCLLVPHLRACFQWCFPVQYSTFSVCFCREYFKQYLGEETGKTHGVNRGNFHGKDESFIFIPYQHPRHEYSSFW